MALAVAVGEGVGVAALTVRVACAVVRLGAVTLMVAFEIEFPLYESVIPGLGAVIGAVNVDCERVVVPEASESWSVSVTWLPLTSE